MKKLYELPTTLLDWFGSEEVRGHIGILNDTLQLSGPKRMIIPGLIQSIETGELHPQKLESKLAELIPDAPGEKITRASNFLMERVVDPVMETLEEVHGYTIDAPERSTPSMPEQSVEEQTEKPLHDPLETGGRTKLDEMFNLPPLPKKAAEENIPKTPEEPIEKTVDAFMEEQTQEQPIEEPEAQGDVKPLISEQPEVQNSASPRIFQNFATALDEHTEKNPVLENTEDRPRPKAIDTTTAPTAEHPTPEAAPDEHITDEKDALFDPLAGKSDISFDTAPEETPIEPPEEKPAVLPAQKDIPTEFPVIEQGTIAELPPQEDGVNEQPPVVKPTKTPAAEQPSTTEEKTVEEMLMADTIDLSETNPEVETATTISVAPQEEVMLSEEQNTVVPEQQPETSTETPADQEKEEESLKPQFEGKAKPFILHEERKEERSNEPHLNSYESIKPSFYKPTFSHEEQNAPAPVAARLEFGDAEETEKPTETTSPEAATSEKRSIPVSYAPATETVSPFGRTNESSNTPVHPRNIVNLKDGEAQKETPSVHPNNVVNLKDRQ
jgi:hypothetical protein